MCFTHSGSQTWSVKWLYWGQCRGNLACKLFAGTLLFFMSLIHPCCPWRYLWETGVKITECLRILMLFLLHSTFNRIHSLKLHLKSSCEWAFFTLLLLSWCSEWVFMSQYSCYLNTPRVWRILETEFLESYKHSEGVNVFEYLKYCSIYSDISQAKQSPWHRNNFLLHITTVIQMLWVLQECILLL